MSFDPNFFDFEVLFAVCGIGWLFYFFYNKTRARRLEAELHRIEARAKQLTDARDHFYADASHEVRTPLHAILGFGQLLQRSNLDERQKEMVDGIQSASETLLKLLDDLLDASKMEAGMLRIEQKTFNLRAVLTEVEQLFSAKLAEKRLGFRIEIAPDTPNLLLGDATRLMQILANLVGNAVKFTQTGYVFILVETVEIDKNNRARLRFLIKDTGSGIPLEMQDRIFDRFQQMEDGSSRSVGGVGLGLAIVRELCKLMDGQVSLESHLGFGTTFMVEIPLPISTQLLDNQPVSPRKNVETTVDFLNKKILLVDDNPLNRKLAVLLLQEWGCLVTEAETGETALDFLKKEAFDALLLDIQLPGIDGYSTAQIIRIDLKNDLPIIALTGFAQTGEREKCRVFGMNDYLQKPVNEADLEMVLRKYFHKITPNLTKNEPIWKQNVLNLAYLLNLSKGRHAFVREMLDMFGQQVPTEMAALRTAILSKNLEQIQTVAHNLRSTAAYVGMREKSLAEIDKIEQLAREKQPIKKIQKQLTTIENLIEIALKEAEMADF
jgi:CheY-like chemotaxis protein